MATTAAHPVLDAVDKWAGKDYYSYPGVMEQAEITAGQIPYLLLSAGFQLKDLKKLDCLEIGCGGGGVTPHLVRLFGSVHSIDTSLSMLRTFSAALEPILHTVPALTYAYHSLDATSAQRLSSNEPERSPTPEDADRKFPPPRTQWDVGVMTMVLHHVDDMDGLFAGIKGTIKSGGWLVVTEHMAGHHHSHGHAHGSEPLHSSRDASGSVNGKGHAHHLDPAHLERILREQGFTEIHIEVRGTLPGGMPEIPWEKKPWLPNLIGRARLP